MRHYILLALVSLLLAGCGGQIPPDSYRLKVTGLFADEDEVVTSLTIETAQIQEYSIRAEGTNGWVIGCDGHTDMPQRNGHRGLAWIVGSRVMASGSTNDYAKILVRCESSVATGQGAMYPSLSKAAKLKEIFSLAIRDGVYRCDRPLVIGQVRGADLKLSVGHKKTETEPR